MMISGFVSCADAVYEASQDPVMIDKAGIRALVVAAKEAKNGRARLLLHPDKTDSLHEMVIALPPDSFDRPHINDRSGKSFFALSGDFCVAIFNDDGSVSNVIILSATNEFGAKMVRLNKAVWHTIIPLDGDCVFLETNSGPFTGNRYLPGCPEQSDREFGDYKSETRKIVTRIYQDIRKT